MRPPKEIEITNSDKIFYPKQGYTKKDMVEYYGFVAEHMLPLVKDRPVTLKRYPNGIFGQFFFQKNASEHFPGWIPTAEVPRKGKEPIHMVLLNNRQTILYLANQGTLSFHTWLSKADKMEYPDRMIFDLDPPKRDYEMVKDAAKTLKSLLEDELELPTFVMTTGSKGLHVVVPLVRSHHVDEVKAFAKDIGKLMSHRYREKFTIEHRKVERKGRLFVDYLRNEFGQTGIAPYSLRPKPGAPAAVPVQWERVFKSHFHPQYYCLKNIKKAIEKEGDPWEGIDKAKTHLSNSRKTLDELLSKVS